MAKGLQQTNRKANPGKARVDTVVDNNIPKSHLIV
jgi:hypothetical protein